MASRALGERAPLPVDPSNNIEMHNQEPVFPLWEGGAGEKLWALFADDPPFWWDYPDLPMVGLFCRLTDALEVSFESGEDIAKLVVLSKEWRHISDLLGLSPNARGRLKLTEAQASKAAARARNAANNDAKPGSVIDVTRLPAE